MIFTETPRNLPCPNSIPGEGAPQGPTRRGPSRTSVQRASAHAVASAFPAGRLLGRPGPIRAGEWADQSEPDLHPSLGGRRERAVGPRVDPPLADGLLRDRDQLVHPAIF